MITTAAASLPEVAGDAALYVDPDDPDGLAAALDLVREPVTLLSGAELDAFVGDTRVLTDDYAPVDQLLAG